jgi:hypothetical protein
MLILDAEPVQQRQPADRAAWLFPESEYLQREWRRAIQTVRGTSRGWLLDKPVTKQENRRA